MQSNTCSDSLTAAASRTAAPVDGEPPLTVGDCVDALNELARLGRQAHDVVVRTIDAVVTAKRSGAVEHIEGLPLDLHLILTMRLPGGDVAMLLNAADVLPTMPITNALFREGRLSWGTVRGIVSRVRGCAWQSGRSSMSGSARRLTSSTP